MFDSFVNRTTAAVRVVMDDSEMIVDAVDVLQVVQVVIDLFRYRFGNGVGSAN